MPRLKIKETYNKKNTHKRIVLIKILYLVIGSAFMLVFLTLCTIHNSSKYQGLKLSQVTCAIPNVCWNPDEDIMNASEHMFYICDREEKYMIYGVELSDCTKEEILSGFIKNIDKIDELKQAVYECQVEEGIRACTNLLNHVINKYEMKKPSYTVYSYSSEETMKEGKYQSFIIFFTQDDVQYLQIIIYESPDLISEDDKEKIELWTYLH